MKFHRQKRSKLFRKLSKKKKRSEIILSESFWSEMFCTYYNGIHKILLILFISIISLYAKIYNRSSVKFNPTNQSSK